MGLLQNLFGNQHVSEVMLAHAMPNVSSRDYRANRNFNPSVTSTPPLSRSPTPKQLRTKSSTKTASNGPTESARPVQLLSNDSVYVLGLPRNGRPVTSLAWCMIGRGEPRYRRRVLTVKHASLPYSSADSMWPVSRYAISVLVRELPILVHANSRLGSI